MRILQVNSSVNSGSTGRIAEDLSKVLILNENKSCIAYGRKGRESESQIIKIGSKWDIYLHILKTRLFDRHGFGSANATRSFIKEVDKFAPDLIHLHNLHGYYLNVDVFFEYLICRNQPVVWTFHDCWPFTGHCSHFQFVNCYKWQSACHNCPNTRRYPNSWLIDNSNNNFQRKKRLFTGLKKIVLVSPSEWLAGHLRNSFLRNYEIKVINNGIDLDKFNHDFREDIRIKYNLSKKYILGVASIWTERKGLGDFINLRDILDTDIEIVLIGLTQRQIKSLPFGIKGISRTESVIDLASVYSGAEVFVNPTYVDNFPTVNIESLACGTPVITYFTGGSSEIIDNETGRTVQKGDIIGLKSSILELLQHDRKKMSEQCRNRAEKLYDSKKMSYEYLSLYGTLFGTGANN